MMRVGGLCWGFEAREAGETREGSKKGGGRARVGSKIRGDGDCEREDAAKKWVYMALDGR